MTDMPKAGFLCAGKTPLALSCSVFCAYKIMDILKECGFAVGACHTEITEPFNKYTMERAKKTLEHICVCCELVITIGCDGFAVSDIMPDITEALCDRSVPYFGAVLCGARSILENGRHNENGGKKEGLIIAPSRATAGICGNSLVLNFPENAFAAVDLISLLIPAVGFTVYNLSGKSARNSDEFKKFLNSSLDFHEVFKKQCIVNL